MTSLALAKISISTICQAAILDEEGYNAFVEARSGATTDEEVEEYLGLLHASFVRSGDIEKLKKAIKRSHEWASATPDGHDHRSNKQQIVDNLSHCLNFYIRERIEYKEGFIVFVPDSKSMQTAREAQAMMYSADVELQKYDDNGDLDHLQRALGHALASIGIMGVIFNPMLALKVADVCDKAFNATNNPMHLGMAVAYASMGALFMHEKFLDRASRLMSLCDYLLTWSSQEGEDLEGDLANEVIRILHHLVQNANALQVGGPHAISPSEHTGALGRLGRAYGQRSVRLGSSDDLRNSIKFLEQALSLAGSENPRRELWLSHLASSYLQQYARHNLEDDLDLAIKYYEESSALPFNAGTQLVNDNRNIQSTHLSEALRSRYVLKENPDDMTRGIAAARQGAENFTGEHPDRAWSFTVYSKWMTHKYKVTNSIGDLNIGLEYAHKAVSAVPRQHAHSAHWQIRLGELYRLRFKHTGATEDGDAELATLLQAWDTAKQTKCGPSVFIKAATHLGSILGSKGARQNWELASTVLAEAVARMHDVAILSLQQSDKEWALKRYAGLASEAAAFSLNAGKPALEALKLLDQGRELINNSLMSLRGDVDVLAQKRPDLSTKLLAAWEMKNHSLSSAQLLRQTLMEIRAVEGFESFQEPLGEKEFLSLAQKGPVVVISISSVRGCDAFLITEAGIQLKPLPEVRRATVQGHIPHLTDPLKLPGILEWLWYSICEPCLNDLGFISPVTDGKWPHVWWIPTGGLTLFPFHAAGLHHRTPSDSVIDRVVSSYGTSLKALHYQRGLKPKKSESKHALLVAMPITHGCLDLPYVSDEVHTLGPICESMGLNPLMDSQSRAKILSDLCKSTIFHFAGHGNVRTTEPSLSSLRLNILDDCQLTVGDIQDLRLHEDPPFMAYLSACSTGVVRRGDLADEGIHLAGAFQLAGFRHVICTLWNVNDHCCVEVAKIVYETLRAGGTPLSDKAAREGLHFALRSLRSKSANELGSQKTVSEMHIGKPSETAQQIICEPTPAQLDSTDRIQVLVVNSVSSVKPPGNFLWVPFVHFGS
ncbi:CHAT domain-containing protein [Plectosphaerella cucumerina]|uniref:CHAT domain-containing protein n=1 Tax=Plectosphaerella cucumerina TaxID=40658 RepID=A0A8K0T996_9PEZI|nr:CHAT domain-containing protein [Plectosphaerella cucumerina]